MCIGYDRLVDAQCDLLINEIRRHNRAGTPFPSPRDPSLMSTNELWYHVSATSKLYLDLKRPLPENVRKWAREQVAHVDQLSFLDPDTYKDIPLLKLVTIYGIYYGVHGQLEGFYLATDRLNHDNVAAVAKRMCVVLSMRDYIDRHWDELILEGVTQTGPRLRRGEFGVSCSFTTLGSYVPGIDSNKLTADLYEPDDQSTRPFVDVHPFNFMVDVEEVDPLYEAQSSEPPQPPIGTPKLIVPPVVPNNHSHPPSPSSYPSPFETGRSSSP